MINFNNILVMYENVLEKRDFKFRCNYRINFFNQDQEELDEYIKLMLYGRVKKIIVIRTSMKLFRDQNIYIFKND